MPSSPQARHSPGAQQSPPSQPSSLSPSRRPRRTSSSIELRRPVPARTWQEPTLEELMRAEEEREAPDVGAEPERRRWSDHPPASAELHPPLYGRPGPTPSPDALAALLQPLLSLSRPSSRPPSPALSASSSSSHPPTSVPIARSSSSLPAHFPPRTPSDPGPTVESQGFVLYLSSLVAWIAFLVWGLCPDEVLEWMGVLWYPSREWALLFPAWTIMLAAFVYFSYIALNICITPALDSLHTLTDTQAYILEPGNGTGPHPLLVNSVLLPHDSVPPLHDLPIGLVNRVVLGDFRRRARRPEGAAREKMG